jgi:CheY-like chemotaxis protein
MLQCWLNSVWSQFNAATKLRWPASCIADRQTSWLPQEYIVSTASATRDLVVVAEDHNDIRQLVGDILRDEGYQVVAVSRGAEVLPAVKKHKPQLILLDLSFPDVPGNEILRQLNASPDTNQIPVIVVSAYTEQLRRVPQVRGVVNKPFDLSTLIDAVGSTRRPRVQRV